MEGQTVHLQTRLFLKSQSSHVHVQGVVGQGLQTNIGTDITQIQVVRVEATVRRGDIIFVVRHTGTAHDERVDLQVEGRMGGRILRCQGVEHELVVGLRLRILPVETGMGTEQLCRRDGDASFGEWHELDLGRQAGHTEHLFLLLVVDQYVVDDHTVEETQIDTAHGHLGAQLLPKYLGHFRTDVPLGCWQVRHAQEHQVDGDDAPDGYTDKSFENFHVDLSWWVSIFCQSDMAIIFPLTELLCKNTTIYRYNRIFLLFFAHFIPNYY